MNGLLRNRMAWLLVVLAGAVPLSTVATCAPSPYGGGTLFIDGDDDLFFDDDHHGGSGFFFEETFYEEEVFFDEGYCDPFFDFDCY